MGPFPRPLVAGVFVGGRSTRMGGQPKGLLRAPSDASHEGSQSLVGRWRTLFTALGLRAVLVGEHPAYAHEGMPFLADARPDLGPLGGLVALLRHAGDGDAIAVACDMPFVSAALLSRLAGAPPCAVLAPRRHGRWEPFFARFDARAALSTAERHAAGGPRSLQALLDALGATELPLSEQEARELRDWDSPEDLAR
jgi:molybdenum cofactor guanylyltransferase